MNRIFLEFNLQLRKEKFIYSNFTYYFKISDLIINKTIYSELSNSELSQFHICIPINLRIFCVFLSNYPIKFASIK